MSTSEDVVTLYQHFGGSPETYQEVVRERQTTQAEGRWSLLGQVDLANPMSIPQVARRIHPAAVQSDLKQMTLDAGHAIPAAETDFVAPSAVSHSPPISTSSLELTETSVELSSVPDPAQVAPEPEPEPIVSHPAEPTTRTLKTSASLASVSKAITAASAPSPALPSVEPIISSPAAAAVPGAMAAQHHSAAISASVPTHASHRPIRPLSQPTPHIQSAQAAYQQARVAPPVAPAVAAMPPSPPPAAAPVVKADPQSLMGLFDRLAAKSAHHPTKKGVLRRRFDK